MTVLSPILTGETPNDRLYALLEFTKHLNEEKLPDALKVAMLQEHGTYERALFIAAMRGEIRISEAPGDGKGGPGTVVERSAESVVEQKPGHAEPSHPRQPAPTSPQEPPKPAQDDAERTALIKRLQDYNAGLRLPYEVYERLKEMYADRHVEYPNGAVDRLEYLRALPFSWLQYIVTGRNDIPKPVVQR
jgi:hypothetical protein